MAENPILGALIDVDGVLHIDGEPIPGTADALNRLRAEGIPFRLLTNTTVRTRALLGELLRGMRCDVSDEEIITAASATTEYIRNIHPGASCFPLVNPAVLPEFEGIELTDGPDAGVVVIGDASTRFNFENLNHAFRLLMNGAELVVMHRDYYWRTGDGLSLDAGAFITGLELAAGKQATLVGKPSAEFFHIGYNALGLPPEQVVMIGDSIMHDLVPAMALGSAGILLRTGIFMETDLQKATPTVLVDSFVDAPDWILSTRSDSK